MQILDQAVEAIRKQGANGVSLATKLEALAARGDQAARLWQGYLDNPGAPGDKYTIMSWVGAERAKQLHELGLEAHALVNEVCAAAGKQARFLVLDESPIVDAYGGLKEGQTGPQAAQAALATQKANNQHLRELANRVRAVKALPTAKLVEEKAVKPKKVAGKTAGTKKSKVASRKAVPKKAGKQAVKKAAKKPAGKAGKKRR